MFYYFLSYTHQGFQHFCRPKMNKLVSLQLEKLKLTLQAQMGLSHPAQPSMQLE